MADHAPAPEGLAGEATPPFVMIVVLALGVVGATVAFGLPGLVAAMTAMTFLVLGIILWVSFGR